VLVAQPLENPLGRVLLLGRRRTVRSAGRVLLRPQQHDAADPVADFLSAVHTSACTRGAP
jgi:hypothetical protein